MSGHRWAPDWSGRKLPPRWDDRLVDWAGWGPAPLTTARFHVDPALCACERCGSTAEQDLNRGRFRKGVGILYAHRCPDCQLDTVIEMSMFGGTHSWVLDESDYGPSGSWPA